MTSTSNVEPSAATTEQPATYAVADHVATITFNRPKAMNAVNRPMADAVGAAVEAAHADGDVRAVVITGAGRAFCAGADLKEMAQGLDSYPTGHREWDFAGLVRHWTDKPLIAAVNGFALGGGTEIVLACDLAVIDESAVLGLPEVTRSLMAGAGGLVRIQRQVPMKIAAEIALLGAPVTADRAYEIGLVNRVAPAGTALAVATEIAGVIARNGPVAVRATKRMLHQTPSLGSDWDNPPWVRNEEEMQAVLASEDAREGATAFVEKRVPVWKGR